MADLKRRLKATWSKITGGDEVYVADVFNAGGKNRLAVDANISSSAPTQPDALAMVRSSGLHVGESYDRIAGVEIIENTYSIEYSLSGVCQFIIQVENGASGESFLIQKTECEGFLLQENGDNLLQETGDVLKTQGLIPI